MAIEAQLSPIKGALFDDFNTDVFKDILIVGNHFGVEVETVRYDAGHGLLLLGDGNNNFNSSRASNSGVDIPSDSRSFHLLILIMN